MANLLPLGCMRLAQLAAILSVPADQLFGLSPSQQEVSGVTHNAAWIKAGDAFVAIRGAKFDGHTFLQQVKEKGAVAVIGEGLSEGQISPLPYLKVPSARAALADAATALAGHPSQKLKVIGVTGTDGKTTTSWLTRHLLRQAGLQTGLLSTVGYELPDGELRHFPAHFTTPEAPQVQATLQEMLAVGGEAVVLEASSHALALDRVRGIDWDIAIWTQLSSEHLDFHGTVENYFTDKRKLVERAKFAVLNADDPWVSQLMKIAPTEVTYSIEDGPNHTGTGYVGTGYVGTGADWQASNIEERSTGLHFLVASPLGQFVAGLPMIGRFNVANALAAMAAAAHFGASTQQLMSGLASFKGVPGRMELVEGKEDAPRVIVDFTHTPPSLEKALSTLRTTTTGQLWVVLGSAGGPRDPYKRAPLGEVATRLADHAIFTEEDHRDTPLKDILAEMERGAMTAGHSNFKSIGNRKEAICYAIAQAKAGDTILLAGKGPEDTLERDTETIAWNEVEEARQALKKR